MTSLTPLQGFVPECEQSAFTPAVVFGASVNGLSWVRSLGRRGVPVLCADTYAGIASKSRFGTFAVLESEPGEDVAGEAAADRLIASLNARGFRPAVFGSADAWQVYIARRAALDDPGFDSLAPNRETMERIVDKQAQYEFAAGVGIAVPPFANAGDVLRGEVAWETYPAIIKPRWAHTGRGAIGGKAVRVDSPEAMYARLDELSSIVDIYAYLVQTVIAGRDDCLHAYLGCFDGDGREFSHVMKRKLRQHPTGFGDGSYDVTCEDSPMTEAGRTLMAAMGYRGPVGIEFKQDPATGEFAMIEINPRTVSTNQLAITAGVDFPWHAYQLVVHGGSASAVDVPHEARRYRVGVHHVHEEREFRSFLERRRRGEVRLFAWLREVMRAESYAIWDRGDPWPFVCSVAAGLRRRFGSGKRQAMDEPVDAGSSPAKDAATPAEQAA